MGVVVAPQFATTAGSAQAGELTRAILTMVRVDTQDTLGVARIEIDPGAEEWVLETTFEVPEESVEIYLLIQLVSVTDGVETVEWSGRTPPMRVQGATAPREIRQVDMYRGPPENLDVDGVELEGVVESLIEGDSIVLGAQVSGGGEDTRVFFESRNPDVIVITEEGLLRALRPGTATILAAAGPAADSARVRVDEWPLPAREDVEALFPGMDDGAARILPALGDQERIQGVAEALDRTRTALASREGLEASEALKDAREALDAYRAESDTAERDAPDLSVVELVMIHLERVLMALRS